jgi:hypothetical protein
VIRQAQNFANKLLVLIDGRSVYTPLFSGVYWDAQDVLLDDVARIEVISGPGSHALGRERHERRDQHHYARGCGYAGRSDRRRRAAILKRTSMPATAVS